MNAFTPFGIPGFDPSKMDPKILMELSQLIQRLPAEQLSRMQTLMHNTMAGYDMKKELEEFERDLPPDFREKITKILGSNASPSVETPSQLIETPASKQMNLYEARLILLRAVASGTLSPEEAEKLLFNI